VQIGNGRSTLFCTDAWLHGHSVKDAAPTVFALVGKRTCSTQTVADALRNRNWIRRITGGLSVQAICQYLMLWNPLDGLELQSEVDDKILWRWSADGQNSAKTAYAALHCPLGLHPFGWTRVDLGYLGSSQSQDLPVAFLPQAALDYGPTVPTRPRRQSELHPM